jgi:hypothetical protein
VGVCVWDPGVCVCVCARAAGPHSPHRGAARASTSTARNPPRTRRAFTAPRWNTHAARRREPPNCTALAPTSRPSTSAESECTHRSASSRDGASNQSEARDPRVLARPKTRVVQRASPLSACPAPGCLVVWVWALALESAISDIRHGSTEYGVPAIDAFGYGRGPRASFVFCAGPINSAQRTSPKSAFSKPNNLPWHAFVGISELGAQALEFVFRWHVLEAVWR